jgi:IS605 OrfB family transposase
VLLTYKIKHARSFGTELEKARQVACFALLTKSRTSKDVKEIGLPSAISNQILKKYSSNKKLKRVRSVKLTVPSQAIKIDRQEMILTIRCLKLSLKYYFRNDRDIMHSWSYYCLKKQIEYKAKLLGVPIALVDPHYTSQDCSKCHLRGNRQGKLFK